MPTCVRQCLDLQLRAHISTTLCYDKHYNSVRRTYAVNDDVIECRVGANIQSFDANIARLRSDVTARAQFPQLSRAQSTTGQLRHQHLNEFGHRVWLYRPPPE